MRMIAGEIASIRHVKMIALRAAGRKRHAGFVSPHDAVSSTDVARL
jgi:hypothetical protein